MHAHTRVCVCVCVCVPLIVYAFAYSACVREKGGERKCVSFHVCVYFCGCLFASRVWGEGGTFFC